MGRPLWREQRRSDLDWRVSCGALCSSETIPDRRRGRRLGHIPTSDQWPKSVPHIPRKKPSTSLQTELGSCSKALVPTPTPQKPGAVVHSCNPGTWEEVTGGSCIEGHFLIHGKLGTSLGYTKSCLFGYIKLGASLGYIRSCLKKILKCPLTGETF